MRYVPSDSDDREQLAKLAAWWNEMPEDALDDPVNSYAKLDTLSSAVPELLVENSRLRAIIDEFMRHEGPEFPPSYLCAYALGTLDLGNIGIAI